MTADIATPNFESWRALILHRQHEMVEAIVRQLRQIGITAETYWPELPVDLDAGKYNIIFFDADMGHDGQFPWGAGETPMPAIALIGSEAPGRIAWAIKRGADAHLLKPVGSGGIYSAVLIATRAFARRAALGAEAADLSGRLAKRQSLAEATAHLMISEGVPANEAFRRLRKMAMHERQTLEGMAEIITSSIRRKVSR